MINRPNMQIDGLHEPEGAFHQGQRFVAAYGCGVVELLAGQAGAHDIDAIGGGLGVDRGAVA